MRHNEEAESEDEKTFSLVKLMLYGTNNFLIRVSSMRGGLESLFPIFSKIIEKKGWDFFCKHKAPGFATLAR